MKNFSFKKAFAVLLALSMMVTSFGVQSKTIYAASKKVKNISVKIGSKNVTKKTFKIKKGNSKKLNVSVKPASSKKSITYKSKNKKIAKVSKKGKITAKKIGTTKIIIKVKDKDGYSEKTWVKVKVYKNKKATPSVTETPNSEKLPEITINNLSDTESNNVDTETIDVSGTAKTSSGSISKVTYSLRFALEETASISGEAEGTTEWKIKNIPLQIGTSFLTINVFDPENGTASKEIILNRLNNEIVLSENVVLYTDDQTSVIANDIVDYWIDDMRTPDDTYDDQTKVLFKENSEIVQSIKSGALTAGDVIMLQPCEELYLGFNGVLVSNEEPENTQKYDPSEYEIVTFTSADYTDIFTGDVSLSYELVDAENPIAFAYFPSDVEIYSTDDSGKERSILYNNNNNKISLYGAEVVGDQTEEQEIKDVGFQKNALSYMMNDSLNITGGLSSSNGMNIGIKFRDTVLFDADGKKDTKNDQFKFGGSILYKNFKVNAGIEWHPNFNPFNLDLLPQQVMGKYSYTEEVDAHADWTGKISLDNYKDDKGNKVGFVKAVNKILKNDFENNKQFMGITLSGVDMSDSIILGAFGLQISPAGVTPTVGIKNAQYSSVFTPLSAILVIMPVINVSGEISAKVGFTYNYSSYNEKGINMQKKDYVGAYGSLADNRGQDSIELPFDRSLEIYNVCSKSSSDKSSEPVWKLAFTGEGKAEEKIALGADLGLMIAGIMPTSAEIKIYESADIDLKGQIQLDNENGLTLDGSAEINAKFGVMAGVHFKLAASTALFSPEIKGDKEWDLVLWEANLSTDDIKQINCIRIPTDEVIDCQGTSFSSDIDSDGKFSIYAIYNGKKILVDSSKYLSFRILTDGKMVYYCYSNYHEGVATVYKKDLSSGDKTVVFTESFDESFGLCGFYNGCIYYIRGLDPGTLCRYDLNSNAKKELLDNRSNANQYGKYFIATPYEGDYSPRNIMSFDASDDTVIVLADVLTYRIISEKIYMVIYKNNYVASDYINPEDCICDVVKCDLNGKNMEKLLSDVRINGYITELTESYLIYSHYDYDDDTSQEFKLDF